MKEAAASEILRGGGWKGIRDDAGMMQGGGRAVRCANEAGMRQG